MTDDLRALDEEIAEAREWFVDDLGVWIEPQNEDESICDIWNRHTWGGSGGARWSENEPPPFSSSWALAGPLLEELWRGHGEDGPCLCSVGHGFGYLDGIECGPDYDLAHLPPCEAIARAWLAWHRSK